MQYHYLKLLDHKAKADRIRLAVSTATQKIIKLLGASYPLRKSFSLEVRFSFVLLATCLGDFMSDIFVFVWVFLWRLCGLLCRPVVDSTVYLVATRWSTLHDTIYFVFCLDKLTISLLRINLRL